MKKPIAKRIFEFLFVAVILATMIFLYYVIAKEIGVDFIHQIKAQDYDGAKEQLRDLGLKGAFCIIAIEMLQMLVVFAPQEFIQICAGLAFPWYLAIPICIAGIFLGSSLIFAIVRLLHLRLETLEKGETKVNAFVKHLNKKTSITLIVYLMFIMPILPIGAIAYFAASSKISYKRFALVCTTGVIPDVVFAYFIGHILYDRLGTGQFVFALTFILLLVGLLLFIVINLIKLFFFKKDVEKPNFLLYHVLFLFVNIFLKKLGPVRKVGRRPRGKRPFIVIGAHTSFYDFYYLAKAVYPRRLNMVVNKYYTQIKSTRKILKYLNVIPKKLFTVDTETAKGLLLAKDNKCNIGIFPEGRLSSSGQNFTHYENVAALVKKLGIDVYFYSTTGGYFSYPKWRKSICKTPVEVRLEKLWSAEELENLSKEDINQVITEKLTYNDCEKFLETKKFPKDYAYSVKGLESLIFHCPHCGANYTLSSTETTLSCSNCNTEFAFDKFYTANGMTIADIYEKQLEYVRMMPLEISDNCTVMRLEKPARKMTEVGSGHIAIANEQIVFKGVVDGEEVTMSQTPDAMHALAFGCGEQFEFYHDGKLYYFYPEKKETCAQWSIIWDVIVESHKLKQLEEKNK